MSKKTICVDLDGVLARYDGWHGLREIGEPIPGAREFINALVYHYRVVIFTSRCSTSINPKPEGFGSDEKYVEFLVSLVGMWLTDNGFSDVEIWSGQGKPPAAAYVDDRSVVCRPQLYKVSPKFHFDEVLLQVAELVKDD